MESGLSCSGTGGTPPEQGVGPCPPHWQALLGRPRDLRLALATRPPQPLPAGGGASRPERCDPWTRGGARTSGGAGLRLWMKPSLLSRAPAAPTAAPLLKEADWFGPCWAHVAVCGLSRAVRAGSSPCPLLWQVGSTRQVPLQPLCGQAAGHLPPWPQGAPVLTMLGGGKWENKSFYAAWLAGNLRMGPRYQGYIQVVKTRHACSARGAARTGVGRLRGRKAGRVWGAVMGPGAERCPRLSSMARVEAWQVPDAGSSRQHPAKATLHRTDHIN